MTSRTLLLSAAALLLGLVLVSLLLLREFDRQQRLRMRVQMLHGQMRVLAATRSEALHTTILRLLGRLGQAILKTGMISQSSLKDVENTLATSGLPKGTAVGAFIGGKVLFLCLCPLLAWFVTRNMSEPALFRMLLPTVAAVLGLVTPDILVKKWRQHYLDRLEQALPDALDMLVICTQAGLALAPAVIRVANELQTSYREIATEFAMTAHEFQVSPDSRTALTNLGKRTGLDSFKRLATTLGQAIQYGTPVSDALRILSSEMRQEALTRFEERAARLPVLLTLPMIMFILPCTFLIVGGPAIIQVAKVFVH